MCSTVFRVSRLTDAPLETNEPLVPLATSCSSHLLFLLENVPALKQGIEFQYQQELVVLGEDGNELFFSFTTKPSGWERSFPYSADQQESRTALWFPFSNGRNLARSASREADSANAGVETCMTESGCVCKDDELSCTNPDRGTSVRLAKIPVDFHLLKRTVVYDFSHVSFKGHILVNFSNGLKQMEVENQVVNPLD